MTTRQQLTICAGETNMTAQALKLQGDDGASDLLRDVVHEVYCIVQRCRRNKLTVMQLRTLVQAYVANLSTQEAYSMVCAALTAIVG